MPPRSSSPTPTTGSSSPSRRSRSARRSRASCLNRSRETPLRPSPSPQSMHSRSSDPTPSFTSSRPIMRSKPTPATGARCAPPPMPRRQGWLVTFGIVPTAPETGYGYIETGAPIAGPVAAVKRFTEKPQRADAEAMIASGNYSWNSGMFMLGANTFIEECRLLAPETLAAAEEAVAKAKIDLDFVRIDADAFAKAPEHLGRLRDLREDQEGGGSARSPSAGPISAAGMRCGRRARARADGNVGTGPVTFTDTHAVIGRHREGPRRDRRPRGRRRHRQRGRDLCRQAQRGPAGRRAGQDIEGRSGHGSPDRDAPHGLPALGRLLIGPQRRALPGQAAVREAGKAALAAKAPASLRALGGRPRHRRGHRRRRGRHSSTRTSRSTCRSAASTGSPIPGKILLELIEVQTGSYLGEDDIVRIQDDFGRT